MRDMEDESKSLTGLPEDARKREVALTTRQEHPRPLIHSSNPPVTPVFQIHQ